MADRQNQYISKIAKDKQITNLRAASLIFTKKVNLRAEILIFIFLSKESKKIIKNGKRQNWNCWEWPHWEIMGDDFCLGGIQRCSF